MKTNAVLHLVRFPEPPTLGCDYQVGQSDLNTSLVLHSQNVVIGPPPKIVHQYRALSQKSQANDNHQTVVASPVRIEIEVDAELHGS